MDNQEKTDEQDKMDKYGQNLTKYSTSELYIKHNINVTEHGKYGLSRTTYVT